MIHTFAAVNVSSGTPWRIDNEHSRFKKLQFRLLKSDGFLIGCNQILKRKAEEHLHDTDRFFKIRAPKTRNNHIGLNRAGHMEGYMEGLWGGLWVVSGGVSGGVNTQPTTRLHCNITF